MSKVIGYIRVSSLLQNEEWQLESIKCVPYSNELFGLFLLPRGRPRPRGTALGAILFGLLFFVRVHLRLKRSLF